MPSEWVPSIEGSAYNSDMENKSPVVTGAMIDQ